MQFLAKTDDEGRNVRIPLPAGHWWPIRAQEKLREFAAAKKAKRLPGWEVVHQALREKGIESSVDKVRRCINGEVVTWELADAISELFGIPPPAVKSTSEAHALALVKAPVVDEFGKEVDELLEKLRVIREKSGPEVEAQAIEAAHARGVDLTPRDRDKQRR